MEWIELGELVEQIRGVTYKKNDTIFEKKVNYVPIIRANNIQNFKFDYSDVLYLNFDKIKKEQYIMDGDIIIASSSGSKKIVGKAVQAKKNMGFSFGAFCKLIRVNNIKVNNRYVGYYFNSNKYRNEISNLAEGANINNIRNEHIDNLKIPVPSLEIQKQIVNILDKAQEIIDKKKEQIKLLDNLIESIFYHMFGDPVRNEKGWEVKKLSSFGEWGSGGTPSRKNKNYFLGDINWYSAGELNYRYTKGSLEKINSVSIENSSAKLFNRGSIFVGMYDSAAFKLSILNEDSSCNQACANLKPNGNYNVEWVYDLFKFMKPVYLQKRRGVRQKNLSQSIIKNFEAISPPIALQNDFAKKVEVIEEQKKKLSQSLELMEENYKSIMDKAFKGQLF